MEVFILNNMLNNQLFATQPDTVDGVNNTSFFFYRNQLYTLIHSIFDFDNLPEGWDIDYIKDHLFRTGFIGICTTPKNGILPLQCGISGYNYANKPTELIVANPVVGSFKNVIGEDGELLYINYVNGGYYGLEALVTRYATMLASCDCSINTSLINSRLAHIFYANSTADLKTMKKIYDDISAGKPAVFLKKGMDEVYDSKNEFINVKQNFIAKEVLDVKKEILREFLTYIGINNAMEKRERSITEEMNVNLGEVMSMVSLWKDTLDKCLERINNLFGFDISIKYNDEVIRQMQQSDTMEVNGDELN